MFLTNIYQELSHLGLGPELATKEEYLARFTEILLKQSTAKKKTYISDEKYLCGKPKSKSMLLKAVAEIKFLKNDPDCTKQ